MAAGLKDHYTAEQLVSRYNVGINVIRRLIRTLDLGKQFGHYRVLSKADLRVFEDAMKEKGYPVDGEKGDDDQ